MKLSLQRVGPSSAFVVRQAEDQGRNSFFRASDMKPTDISTEHPNRATDTPH